MGFDKHRDYDHFNTARVQSQQRHSSQEADPVLSRRFGVDSYSRT